MSTKTINTRVINKHDVEANWNKAVNFVPLKGEIIVYEKDDTHTTARFKIGDGTTKVTELPFSSIPDTGGSSNAVTYESDGSLKIGDYASITDSNMGTGVRELVANGSLGPAHGPMKITFGYTNSIYIPMGYDDHYNTGVNFTSSTFQQPTFTIHGTSNSLKIYDGEDLYTLIDTMKSKKYTSLYGAINALITNGSGSGSSTTIITTYTATVSLDNNKEYHLISKNSTSLTLTLPSTITDDYNSYFSFKSGATATTITLPTSFTGTLKFKGDDCNSSGVFTPTANKIYEVALKCIGMDSNNKPYIVARVGAC